MTSSTPGLTVAERLRAEHGAALALGEDCDLPDDDGGYAWPAGARSLPPLRTWAR